MTTQDQLDKIANDYNKTKDPNLKKLWYKKIKKLAYGTGYYNSIKVSSFNINHRSILFPIFTN